MAREARTLRSSSVRSVFFATRTKADRIKDGNRRLANKCPIVHVMRLPLWATSGRNGSEKRSSTSKRAKRRGRGRERDGRDTKFKERLKRRAARAARDILRPTSRHGDVPLRCRSIIDRWDHHSGSSIDEISRICMLIQATKVWTPERERKRNGREQKRERERRAEGWVGGAVRDHPARVGGREC